MPTTKSNKIELLAPAGNFEKLEIAIHYGADAVYLGGKDFSLRNFAGNFSLAEIKGINYLASVVKVYREAIDRYYQDPMGYAVQPEWLVELNKIDRRGFCTGFYFDDPQQTVPDYDFNIGAETHLFIGKVLTAHDDGRTLMEVRNKCGTGDRVEILSPRQAVRSTCIETLRDEKGNLTQVAQPGTRAYPELNLKTKPNDLIRKIIQPGWV